jgi:AcrR family transcriptional regulator
MGTAERRKREKEARVALITKSAAALFRKKGLENTSIEDVARAAELAKGTIYLYFNSKEELYYNVLEPALVAYHGRLVAIADNKDEPPDVTLRRIMDFVYEEYMKQPEPYHLIMRYKAEEFQTLFSRERFDRLRNLMGGNLKKVSQVVERGIQEGLFIPADPRVVSTVIWNVFVGVIQFEENRTFNGGESRLKHTLEVAMDLILRGLKAAS